LKNAKGEVKKQAEKYLSWSFSIYSQTPAKARKKYRDSLRKALGDAKDTQIQKGGVSLGKYFVLLTVHLSIILVIDAKNLVL